MTANLPVATRTNPNDQFVAAMAGYFFEGGERAYAALALSVEWSFRRKPSHHVVYLEATILCNRAMCERLEDSNSGYHSNDETETERDALYRAFAQIARAKGFQPSVLDVKYKVPDFDNEMMEQLRQMVMGKTIHNQAPEINGMPLYTWETLHFRSKTEIVVAEALERAGVMFLPNCRSRLGLQKYRRTLEADFLIIANGYVGILEIDGEPYHPPERKAQADERSRVFKRHGIVHIEHYNAKQAYANPDGIVRDFLKLLMPRQIAA